MATVYDIEPRATVVAVSPEVGLIEGYDRFMKVIEGAAGLRARLRYMQQESLTLLEAALREETAADDDDRLPALMAGRINWIHTTLLSRTADGMIKARPAGEVSR
ncbi:hypothetical protein AB0M68_05035 [Streptomyces sp. NPDC051453]|uniref:hypothetical protein n=1 Tax=Streptomyces sp. NPDC051453 TaxID=3154941 RepID=UPI0034422129